MVDTYPLNLVQGARFRRGLRYRINGIAQPLTAYGWRAQIRAKEQITATLVLDLNEHMAIDAQDDTLLMLDLGGLVTAGLPKLRDTASWDLFIWPLSDPQASVLLVQGAVTLDPATTDIREGG